MDSRQSKVIEKIEKAGLLEKHNQLITQGYTNPWFNYKLLKEHDGNLDSVIVFYNEHRKKKDEQNAKALKILETMGWLNKHQELVEKGFAQVKNLKALLRTEGDVAKSIEKLSNKKEVQTDQPIEQIVEQHGFKVQYEKLKEMGYDNDKRIVRLLLKFNGNLEPIIDKLLSGREGRHHHCKKREGKCEKKDKDSQEFQEFKLKKKEFKKKLQQLEQSGIHRHKAVKLLAIWNGDADAVIKWANQVKPQNKAETQTLQEQQVPAQE